MGSLLDLANAYASDPEIRSRADINPVELLSDFGVSVSFDSNVSIVQNTKGVFHFVMPPNPNESLSDEELEVVSGGSFGNGEGMSSLATASSIPSTVSTLSTAA